ncbi:hypothetical protein [Sinomonas halotolerans]|uniref:Uncharacterized protein n=1 Tax=Sinomonas halotolerans TaxID=1644133 RepID=A0ABU9X206_9MICC
MSLIDSRRPRTRRRMHLGEDILLARHGGRIAHLRLDRRSNCMVATLVDGTTDSASNVLAPIAPTPVERLRATVEAVRADTAPVSRAELRALARFSAVWLVVSVLLTAGVVALAASGQAPELMQMGYGYPAF